MHSEISGVFRDIHELYTALETNRVQQRRKFEMMQSNIQRIAVQPGVRQESNTANNEPENRVTRATPKVFTLSPFTRNIHLLWEEYENGIGDRNPENVFTREARGRVKQTYNRRKIL